ncbi:MAG: rhodanese-like domain-containing protein [Cyclobacteriaceae bacterium]|nr:rhodanese-like domain-containing protein [Cyclobacteriaceae bacterium]MCH8517148.1 rhodanese-like domain-containing protein [Cyclobacteriaceae bacterium]
MKDIEVAELKEKIESGEKIHLLDVREEWEFDEDNIEGKLIPLGELPTRLEELEDWKSEEVIVHCRSGKRSDQAKKFLLANGFENVRNVLGGIIAYRQL